MLVFTIIKNFGWEFKKQLVALVIAVTYISLTLILILIATGQ